MILNSRCLGVSISLDSGKVWFVGWFRVTKTNLGAQVGSKHPNLSRCESQNLIVVFVCNVPCLDCAHLVVTPPLIPRFPSAPPKKKHRLLVAQTSLLQLPCLCGENFSQFTLPETNRRARKSIKRLA